MYNSFKTSSKPFRDPFLCKYCDDVTAGVLIGIQKDTNDIILENIFSTLLLINQSKDEKMCLKIATLLYSSPNHRQILSTYNQIIHIPHAQPTHYH